MTDGLVDDGFPVNGINSAGVPELDDDSDDYWDEEDLERFLNMRAQGYWKVKQEFEAGRVDIDDEDLGFELSKLVREFSRGSGRREKLKIEDKEKTMKKLRGRSPDRADSMYLAFAKDRGEDTKAYARFF